MSPRDRILTFLRADRGWHLGLAIAKATEVSRASIYVHLGRLEEAGYVERKLEDTSAQMPRPMYRITSDGERHLAGKVAGVYA